MSETRLDGIGALVVLEIALSLVLLAVTRDPRVVLLKPSFYTAVAGVFLLGTCVIGKPFTMDMTRPMAVGGDPARAAGSRRCGECSGSWSRSCAAGSCW